MPSVSAKILQLCPVPDAAKKHLEARQRKSEKSEVLTSSPYKSITEEKENEKKVKE